MRNQFSGSRVQQQPQPEIHVQYANDYDNYGLKPPNSVQASTQFSREGYHLSSNGASNFYLSNVGGGNIGASRVKSESSRLVSSQVRNEEVVKGESRVNYVPYEKKVIEYEDRQVVEKVPVKRKVVKYQERRVVETVPREVIKQDFYAVEHRVQYYKEIVPEKKIQMVPVERKVKRYEYVPVERQIVHYPENIDLETAKGQSRVVLRNQGVQVKPNAEFRPIDPSLIYNYSTRPESKYTPIGYVQQGQAKVFSNTPTLMQHQHQHQQLYPPNDYGYYQQQVSPPQYYQPTYLRTNSAQYMQVARVHPQRGQYGQSESYIKQLNTIGHHEIKRPFELLQQSYSRQQMQAPSHQARQLQQTQQQPQRQYVQEQHRQQE